MEHALYRIDQTKGAFRDTRRTNTMVRAGKSGHFNFLKWYIISYYLEWIKRYGSITGFTTGIGEAIHIIWIEDFFKRTNMRKGYEKQILDHNVEKFSLIVRDDIVMFSSTKTFTEADKNATLQVNSVSGAKKITKDLKWLIEKDEHKRLQYSQLSSNYRCLAETVADKANVPGLIDVLAVLIKQERAKVRGVESASDERRKENDSSWARKYSIQIHDSITTGKAKSDDRGQVQYEHQAARCAFEW